MMLLILRQSLSSLNTEGFFTNIQSHKEVRYVHDNSEPLHLTNDYFLDKVELCYKHMIQVTVCKTGKIKLTIAFTVCKRNIGKNLFTFIYLFVFSTFHFQF